MKLAEPKMDLIFDLPEPDRYPYGRAHGHAACQRQCGKFAWYRLSFSDGHVEWVCHELGACS